MFYWPASHNLLCLVEWYNQTHSGAHVFAIRLYSDRAANQLNQSFSGAQANADTSLLVTFVVQGKSLKQAIHVLDPLAFILYFYSKVSLSIVYPDHNTGLLFSAELNGVR